MSVRTRRLTTSARRRSGTAGPPVALYTETFGTGVGTWAAKGNASSVVRDTTRYADGALRWTATVEGDTSVISGQITAVTPSTLYRLTAKVSHSAGAGLGSMIGVDTHAAGGAYLSGFYGPWTWTEPGATALTLTLDFTSDATISYLFITAMLFAAPAGTLLYMDEITLAAL